MLRKLIADLTAPLGGRAHDGLFTDFAPAGASAAVMHGLYHQYDGAYADEPVPPQYKHFRALVTHIVAASPERSRKADGLLRVRAAYVSCFERSDAFMAVLETWRREPAFRKSLLATRKAVIADLLPGATAEAKRRRHYARWRECVEAPIDLAGERLLDLIKQMSTDDWHEIAMRWNWDHGLTELDWITAQHECDRATAIYVLAAGKCGDVATGKRVEHAGFVRTIAARLEGGYYTKAELGLHLPLRQATAFRVQIETARALNESPWLLPEGLIEHPGRAHAPKYSVSNRIVHYHYEYWLRHVAP